MRIFSGPAAVRLTGEQVRGREVVELLEPLIYEDAQGQYVIEAGARSDGCSIPWWGWWLAPPIGREARAAFLHDDMLRFRPTGWTRAAIDRRFREAMRSLGTPDWKRNLMWLAVRWQAFATGDL